MAIRYAPSDLLGLIACGTINSTENVFITVQGKTFYTTVERINIPGSLLRERVHALGCQRWYGETPERQQAPLEISFDRDAKLFQHIINFLTFQNRWDCKSIDPSDLPLLEKEAEFFGLSGMKDKIHRQISGKVEPGLYLRLVVSDTSLEVHNRIESELRECAQKHSPAYRVHIQGRRAVASCDNGRDIAYDLIEKLIKMGYRIITVCEMTGLTIYHLQS